MPLEHKGLVKLAEECGELIQAAMKRIGRSDGKDIHWDGSNLKQRLEEEIADVLAACYIVESLHKLDKAAIRQRRKSKIDLFIYWNDSGTETSVPKKYYNKFLKPL